VNSTVDLLYADETEVSEVPIAEVKVRWDPASGIDPLTEVPLIESIRQQNIERNKALFCLLGLDEPLVPPRAPRQRRPKPLSSTALSLSLRGRAASGRTALAPFQVGYDFGYAHALLALQRYDVNDLLSMNFGEDLAGKLVETYFVRSRERAEDGPGEPLSLVLFARVQLSVVGMLLLRVYSDAVPGVVEVPLVVVSPEYEGHSISDALMTYARLVAAQRVFDEPPKDVVIWTGGGATGFKQSLPLASSPANLQGLQLCAPPHLQGARLFHLADGQGTLYRQLEQHTAAAVASLTAADPSATAAAKAAAEQQEKRASQLVGASELHAKVKLQEGSLGPRQDLPNHNEGLVGRTLLLWGVEDA